MQFRAADYLPSGSTDPFIHEDDPGASGCRVFNGGEFDSDTTASQVIDLSGAATEIAGGAVQMRFAALLGALGGSSDNADVTLTYVNAQGADINAWKYSGNTGAQLGTTQLMQVTDSDTVPATTRAIRLELHTAGHLNSASHGFIDNVGLTLDGSDPSVAPPVGCKAPTGATGAASAIAKDAATLNATFDPHGERAHAYIQWGSSSSFGLTAAHTDASGGSGDRTISEQLTGLNAGQTYFYRLVVEGAYGKVEGETKSFTTLAPTAPTPTPPTTNPPPVVQLGPFEPFLRIARQKIRKIIVSGFEARLIWSGDNLAKGTLDLYVLKGKKQLRFGHWVDPGFYAGGTGLTREPKGKAAKYLRKARRAKILIVWSAVTKEGVKRSGRKTVTVKK